jgi:hypothetical protein
MERPVPPKPPGYMVQCSCGRTVQQEIYEAQHTGCAARARRAGNLITFAIVFGSIALALAANPTIPWPWNP